MPKLLLCVFTLQFALAVAAIAQTDESTEDFSFVAI